jgi:hypothetical protein
VCEIPSTGGSSNFKQNLKLEPKTQRKNLSNDARMGNSKIKTSRTLEEKINRSEAVSLPWTNTDKVTTGCVTVKLRNLEVKSPTELQCSPDVMCMPVNSVMRACVYSVQTLPYILGIIDGYGAEKIYLDSGSSLCLIDRTAFPEEQLLPVQNIQLISASGDTIPILGKIILKLQLGRLLLPCEFMVIRNLEMKILAGNSLFKKYKFVMNYDDRNCTFAHESETSGNIPLFMEKGSLENQ